MSTVLDNEVFDPLYSLLRHFPSLSGANKGRLVKLLCATMSRAVAYLSTATPGASGGEGGAAAQRFPPEVKNAFKALCFLVNTTVMVCERNSAAAASVAGGRKRGKKKVRGLI